MDQSPLLHDALQPFYQHCMELYRATTARGEQQLSLSLFGTTISVRLPANSIVDSLLDTAPKYDITDRHPAQFSLYITDNSCEGFHAPVSPFDRYRFTHRGDILGAEESVIKPIYLYHHRTIGVIHCREQKAVWLIRDASLLTAEALWSMMVYGFSVWLAEADILFLPGMIKNSGTVCPTHGGSQQYTRSNPPVKCPPDTVANWVAIHTPLHTQASAVPIGTTHTTPSPVTSLCFDQPGNKPPSAQEAAWQEIRNINRLTFITLSQLPYGGNNHLHLLQRLLQQSAVMQKLTAIMSRRERHLEKISFIIPAYNAAPFLHQAVESIAGTGYPDPEVIIVDDGSTDETANMVHRLPLPCRYLYQPNAGVSAARNRGIAAASHPLIVCLDADDLLNPPALYSLLHTLMMNPGAAAATGLAQKFRVDNHNNNIFVGSPAESYPWYVGAALFRKEAFSANGNFDEALHCSEDTDWFIRAREKNLMVIRVPVITLFVRRHQGNMTRQLGIEDLQLTHLLRKKIARNH